MVLIHSTKKSIDQPFLGLNEGLKEMGLDWKDAIRCRKLYQLENSHYPKGFKGHRIELG